MSVATQTTVAVAMSGGVDSSTVAAVLRRQGTPLVGLTMQLWNQRRLPELRGAAAASSVGGQRCCSLDDVYDARRVAEHLGVPYYVVNYEEQFEENVVRPFVSDYLEGRTPIPCSLCNSALKFDQLLTTARQVGAARIATGHYARIRYHDAGKRYQLLRARHLEKDQTYFLFGLTQEQMARTLFPLGELTKAEVRAMARELGLPVAEKAESQEICFVPAGNYVRFIEAYLGEQGQALPAGTGEVVSTTGEVLGRHNGVHNFTIGQRKGLGVAAGRALYVLELDVPNNRVIVGDDADLRRDTCAVRDVNWVSIARPDTVIRCHAKVRHRHEPAEATLELVGETGARLRFRHPQRAITPGQAAVFYDGDVLLGGGWIE
jgi:tRNA-specific 2-thiouridylase